ncbi:MAG: hypothetical protein LBN34_10075 [Clostridiales Family XIII bacterium]|jgi:hypothetical protein|nr:hypothetical protein [Clostridiales Family XIII bacterium]
MRRLWEKKSRLSTRLTALGLVFAMCVTIAVPSFAMADDKLEENVNGGG